MLLRRFGFAAIWVCLLACGGLFAEAETPVKDPVKEPAKEPAKEPVKEPVKAPVKEAAKKSVPFKIPKGRAWEAYLKNDFPEAEKLFSADAGVHELRGDPPMGEPEYLASLEGLRATQIAQGKYA